ncbi:MAG: site-specific DNA-methyltransferase [Thermoleophilia bacterium]|nr:site-specific DNA-methyltransferase [Thermoleophilia bacterium]
MRKRNVGAGPVRPETSVEALRHKDTRANIPTNELRGLLADDERSPKTMLYPRDPSLDPQLVWKGKDEQDATDLEVPVVPIYIQEKIHPQAIVENLRRTAAAGEPEPELRLFDDFNGIEFAELVDFYQHEQSWTNRLVLGDSLLVMTSLAEKEGLRGKVQTIYVDPPYGIKFGSNWQVSTRRRDVKDGKAQDATRQPEQIRAFRDTWELGIHSYLAYLRDRLAVARELLNESGSVFVQIGDENVHLVRSLLDEVFGRDNFVAEIAFKKTSGAGSPSGGTQTLAHVHDYILWYAKARESVKYRRLYRTRHVGGDGGEQYTWIEAADGTRRKATPAELAHASGRFLRPAPLTSQTVREAQTTVFTVDLNGKPYEPGVGGWKTNDTGMARLKAADRLIGIGKTLCYVRYFDDFPAYPFNSIWEDAVISGFGESRVYVVQTNLKVVERCLLMTSDPGDLVLDPTCGSGTTAVAAEKWGRRWITIDTSRVALALARTRLMAYRYPWFQLRDERDVKHGFVCRTVPRVTLKSIAQNPDIREGMSREEVEAAIARHADQETLHDQPQEDRKKVRVTGPFTVESLSPHRTLDPAATEEVAASGAEFVPTILENLRKAGVQNTVRQEHLRFDWLDSHAGVWVHARGAFTDADGAERTVAVSVGPEYGTVDADQVREAAKEASKGAGADLLLVCGFAFDASAGETAKEFQPADGSGWAVAAEERKLGKLRLLLVRMNPDLAMGADLLKKTGAGNLFMVFGEPDVDIRRTEDGLVQVEIRGVDVYDPTTGQVRSSTTDDIACWFVDTSYNEESFFVREAYFTGAGDPYESLRKALRADIDEAAWATLYTTESRPFPPPETGKIAVKVINHYGDEVMKVYAV